MSARDASTITIIEEITYTILHIYRFSPRFPKKGQNVVDLVPPTPKPTKDQRTIAISILVGGFNPSEKYQSQWESSPNRDENKNSLKPPPSISLSKNLPYLSYHVSAPGLIPPTETHGVKRPSHLAMAKPGFQPCATPSFHRRRAAGHHHRPVPSICGLSRVRAAKLLTKTWDIYVLVKLNTEIFIEGIKKISVHDKAYRKRGREKD